ncbi:hypothetical protein [Fibrobacter sp. UWR2]|uniref:hypothetical protein n=1 Tax=Fibrobacter sp. UWR2 TaxID=1964352 RepID=UPI000B520C2B|nr:hypothetical protein [Fibrobacter sp. UWR2]OWV01924.1 hypothetical protein B7994_01495 [Fibrobacter sp. UWR2]
MFYRHWKKIALALTGLLWASCGDDGSKDDTAVFAPEYGVQVMPSDSIGGAVCLYGVEAPVIIEQGVLCYNDTATNDSGKVFKIIDCTDGNKYLRDPSDAGYEGVELPEGVQIFAPEAGSGKAINCTSDQDICIERNPEKPIEQDSLAGCHPIIECPEKTEQ